ncbi:branched-chain amino acid transport system substrate-binding protein [Desulfonatronum thiosulfatophilum]|uniref:Branched-chain amino acid transport system substrate-binding protein n=1 Tax=Desulfonatronum thiosulfatophilum TaxID=617002 RepID=A0A1G6A0R8_9BACT|nr:branched-chain amino acid ABC transporter substrate-binding protein [Desulfonatronum thiosulfatophilum]SDB01816.1 branched-chain amino acid transport system substrate-binding protein [Desulfonatronum thiosulfatophilum]
MSRNRNRFPIELGLVCILFALTAFGCSPDAPLRNVCADELGCVWIEPGAEVKIVSLHTFSGIQERISREHLRSLEIAIAERGGKLHGHPLVVVTADEQCSRAGGLVSAQKIATDRNIVAVHGPNCSSAAIPATRILSEAGLVLVSGTATAPSLTSQSGDPGEHRQPGFFRTASNDEYQGIAAAHFAYHVLDVRRAATVHDQDAYAMGLAEAFAAAFQELGGEVVYVGAINRGDRNMHPLVQALAGQRPELVFFPIFSMEGHYFIQALRSYPLSEKLSLLSADSLLNRPFLEICGNRCLGMFFIAPDSAETPAYVSYLERYLQTYGEGPQGYFHAHGYDAAVILLHALEQSSFPEPDGSLRIERQRLRTTLSSIRDFPGLTGRLSCDAFGDCGMPRFKLVSLNRGMEFEELLENVIAVHAPLEQANPSVSQ